MSPEQDDRRCHESVKVLKKLVSVKGILTFSDESIQATLHY